MGPSSNGKILRLHRRDGDSISSGSTDEMREETILETFICTNDVTNELWEYADYTESMLSGYAVQRVNKLLGVPVRVHEVTHEDVTDTHIDELRPHTRRIQTRVRFRRHPNAQA